MLLLIEQLQRYSGQYLKLSSCIEEQPTCTFASNPPPTLNNGLRGRPTFQVSRQPLEGLLELGFNFRQIAELIGVSERTIRRRRELYGLPIENTYSNISDEELDGIVADILQVGCA